MRTAGIIVISPHIQRRVLVPVSAKIISSPTCSRPISGIIAVPSAVLKEPVSLLMKVNSENVVPSLRSPVFHSI